MKDSIHPQFNPAVAVTCACGNKFTTGSTAASLHTEVCSQCHPFYTGKQKLLDAAGSIDKFKKRKQAAVAIQATAKVKKVRKTRASKTAK